MGGPGRQPCRLSAEQVEALLAGGVQADPVSQYRSMASMLMLDVGESACAGILLDELFALLAWGAENDLTSQQLSIVLRCAHDALDAAQEAPGKWMTREDNFQLFKAALLKAAVDEAGALIFEVPLLETIVDQISRAFYVRWQALKHAFTMPERSAPLHVVLSVDSPMPKPPLKDAVVVDAAVIGPAPGFEPPPPAEESGRSSKGKRSPRTKSGRKK